MSDYKNIKVDPDEWKQLREDKPSGVTWTRYLKTLREQGESET
jgi:hypothetical protein